jgi:hypothetical protein
VTATVRQNKGEGRDLLAEVRAAHNPDQFADLIDEISEIAPHLEGKVIEAAPEEWRDWAKDIFAKRRRDVTFAAIKAKHDAKYGVAELRVEPKVEPKQAEIADLAQAATAKVRAKVRAIVDRTGQVTFPEIPDAPLPPADASQIDRLTYPRGLLGHVTQYMVDTSELPHRWLALASALTALAKGLDRKVVGPSGSGTVLYILLEAETGAGKQQALRAIRQILKAMGLAHVIAASALASVQAIEEIVEETPSTLILIDEIGAWLNRISAGGQTGNVAEIPGTLQSLWAWSPEDEWIGTKRKGKDMVTVFGPALSIFGDSTEAKLIKGLTKEEMANGFLNRWLLFDIGKGAPERVEPKYAWTQIPSPLQKLLKEVAGDPAPSKGLRKLVLRTPDGSHEAVVQDMTRLTWGAGAKELWLAFEKETRAKSTEKRELWIRAPEQAVRLGTVLAYYRGSLVVEVEDWQWALAVVRYSMAILERSLGEHQREELEQADLVQRIREEFLRRPPLPKDRPVAGELTEGQIRKLCERLTKDYRKVGFAISHLEKIDEIEEFDPERADSRGRPAVHFRWIGGDR